MEDEPELPAHLDEETANELLERVLEAEDARIHMENPLGVNQEIEEAIRDRVE